MCSFFKYLLKELIGPISSPQLYITKRNNNKQLSLKKNFNIQIEGCIKIKTFKSNLYTQEW